MQKSRVQPCPADFRAFFRSSRLCQSTLQLTPASQHLSDAQKLPQQGLKQPAVNGHSKAVQEQSLRSLRIYRDASGVLGNSDGGGDGAGASDGAGDRGAGASDGAGDSAGARDVSLEVLVLVVVAAQESETSSAYHISSWVSGRTV